MNTEGQTTAQQSGKEAIVQVFEGIGKPEEIIGALRRHDVTYVKGVIQFYERFPPNPFLVEFLQKSLCKIRTLTT